MPSPNRRSRILDQRRTRRRRLPRGLVIEFPERTASEFAKEISKMADLAHSRIPAIIGAMEMKREGPVFRKLRRDLLQRFSDKKLEAMITKIAEREAIRQRRLFLRGLGKVLGVQIVPVDPSKVADAPLPRVAVPQGLVAIDTRSFVRESMKNVKSIRSSMIPAMTNSLVRARALGQSPDELAQFWISKGIPVEFGTLEGRAKVIARDQMGNLNSELAKANQTNAGIDSYIWRTEGDDRVRPEHEEREGVKFKWFNPPEDGHPGEPIQCRCHAEPVVEKNKILELLTGFAVRAGIRLVTG